MSSSRSLCNRNDTVSENFNNEDMYNAGTINKLKLENINRLVIGHLDINPLPSKRGQVKLIIEKSIDILLTDSSFPSSQFIIQGFSMLYR